MATQTGTASSYTDLLAKLNTFLTGMATNPWTLLASNTTTYASGNNTVVAEYYWKAPGLSGTEAIYIQARAYYSVAGDYYNIEFRGTQGYNSGQIFTAQPGISPPAYLYAWNQPMPYWFVANGQRVVIFTKVSSVYESAYLGKFLPYGTPGQYPYPVAIGACGYPTSDLRFSDTSGNHFAFFDPIGLHVCDPGGAWITLANWNTGGTANPSPYNVTGPYLYYGSQPNRMNWLTANLDGTYSILPIRLEENSPVKQLLGELDGVGFVTGNANSSESTINDGTNTWTVFQNAFRTAADNYCAVKMV